MASIAVFAGRDGRWAAADRYRALILILTSLIPGFVSFVALALGTLEIHERTAWRASQSVFAAAIAASLFVAFTGGNAIPDGERQAFSSRTAVVAAGGTVVNGIVQLFGAFGGLGASTFAGSSSAWSGSCWWARTSSVGSYSCGPTIGATDAQRLTSRESLDSNRGAHGSHSEGRAC